MEPIIKALLKNLRFSLGHQSCSEIPPGKELDIEPTCAWGVQIRRVTMGVGAATALCRLVLIMQEYKALSNRPALDRFQAKRPGVHCFLLRYVDDVSIIVKHPANLGDDEVEEVIEAFAAFVWSSSLPLKGDAINPLVGLHLVVVQRHPALVS